LSKATDAYFRKRKSQNWRPAFARSINTGRFLFQLAIFFALLDIAQRGGLPDTYRMTDTPSAYCEDGGGDNSEMKVISKHVDPPVLGMK
jgi:hypothetical protein